MWKQRRVHRFHPLGGLTVLRIPSKKGKAGMLLDLGTRVGRRASRGVIDGWVAWGEQQPFLILGGVGGGPGRRAGGRGRWGGPD